MSTATLDPETLDADPSATQDGQDNHAASPASPALEIPVADFDIARHNVVVTAFNPATGQHRTFKVSTILKETTWGDGKRPGLAAGTRVASLLIGNDRDDEGCWKRFGFVSHTGIIRVFMALRGKGGERSDWEKYGVMLAAPQRFKQLEWKLMGYCRRCNRALTRPDSLDSGLGPTCRTKG